MVNFCVSRVEIPENCDLNLNDETHIYSNQTQGFWGFGVLGFWV